MGGRDPHELHRTGTPLELFFDLTFVIAFGVAGSQFAHEISSAIAVAAGVVVVFAGTVALAAAGVSVPVACS
jgi:low temperature requirement protein LtrA